ncbi:hypothetical protein BKI52_39170 [marine bacterium AO1-C]|nr:hypothetical protein BKI52_39170 [marine bacterium AO1-C]
MKNQFIIFLSFLLFGCQASPQAQIPEDFLVGTRYFQWQDTQRSDPYYGKKRLINVQVWYPVAPSVKAQKFKKAPYYHQIELAYKKLGNWSKKDVKMVQKIPTAALVGAPLSQNSTKHPLIIFSPSLGGNIAQYSYYAERLAKTGYIVAGVNHLYESEYVVNAQKKVFTANHRFHDSLKTLNIPTQITVDKYREVKGLRQEVLGQDLIFCLDQLKQSAFAQSINFNKVGVWGHSIGGAASVFASFKDSRFSAVLDLDGTPPSVVMHKGLKKPFMFIEDLTDYNNHPGYKKLHTRRNNFCKKIDNKAYRVLLAGTNHNSFLDINYRTARNDAQRQKALKVLQTTLYYMQGFFDRYLKGQSFELKAKKTKEIEILTFEK